MSPSSVRPEVLEFKPYSAGLSIDEIRERYGLSRVIKMASNENPLGISPMVQKVLFATAPLAFRYIQSGCPKLVQGIAEHFKVSPDRIVVGNGSDEVLDLLIRAKAIPGQHNIVAFRPCFSIYELQARICGIEFRQTPLKDDFTFDWDGLLALTDENTAIVFLTTPDNPSGYCPPVAEVAAFARRLPARSLLIVDEAYMDFCGDEAAHSLLSVIDQYPNIAIIRTFSKSYGLAGLRLGFGVMPPELADYLCRIRLPFSINILAEAAGIAAMNDTDFHRATLEVVTTGRDYLREQLTTLGCTVYPSWTNFLMLRLPEDSGLSVAEVFEALLHRGIITRPLSSYDLPDYLRVSIGNAEENKFFITALTEIFGG